jgi:hypothetical protein
VCWAILRHWLPQLGEPRNTGTLQASPNKKYEAALRAVVHSVIHPHNHVAG